VEESPVSDPGPAGPSPSAAQGLPGPVVSLSGPPARIADGKAGD
jgi:hypothetical protein